MNPQIAVEAFRRSFGVDPEVVSVAPGRINLIGEHTDYNDGFVFPAAIDRELAVAAKVMDGPSRVVSLQMGEGERFDAMSAMPGQVSGWAAYPAGMAWVLRSLSDEGNGRVSIPNVEAIVHSEIPVGSGVSSSAALEMAFAVIYNQLAGLGLDNKRLALLAQKDENQFVGVGCGIMDQLASAMGKEGCAMFLDTRSLDIVYARIPDHLAIVLCDTKTPRALSASAYNERRAQCEEAARILGVRALRDASLSDLEESCNKMPETILRRARHVITEDERCRRFVDALEGNDTKLMGELMRASHESLRDDYEVSSRELDLMAEACWQAKGCIGARMTGAGFGGACVALVERGGLDDFSNSVNLAYGQASNLRGEILDCRSVDGARVVQVM
ncbi:MAG TPA: galactokinase [Fimbriimonadaceae bacterium]|nr:galactokinase [Fimbriimonadaceae bacterium]